MAFKQMASSAGNPARDLSRAGKLSPLNERQNFLEAFGLNRLFAGQEDVEGGAKL